MFQVSSPMLTCYIQYTITSYYTWNVEILSADPRILLYHDAILDSDIVKLKELATAEVGNTS